MAQRGEKRDMQETTTNAYRTSQGKIRFFLKQLDQVRKWRGRGPRAIFVIEKSRYEKLSLGLVAVGVLYPAWL